MKDFYTELDSRGLSELLVKVNYETPVYEGWNKVKECFVDIVENKKSVYIEGDYDVDGLMSTLVLKKGLQGLGVKDVKVYNYRERMHSIDRVAIQQCIQGHYDYYVIADAGSNELGLLRSLGDYGCLSKL